MSIADTFYRESVKLFELNQQVKILAHKLRNKVNLNFFICAETKDEKYTIIGAHHDYDNLSFDIEKGDVLA